MLPSFYSGYIPAGQSKQPSPCDLHQYRLNDIIDEEMASPGPGPCPPPPPRGNNTELKPCSQHRGVHRLMIGKQPQPSSDLYAGNRKLKQDRPTISKARPPLFHEPIEQIKQIQRIKGQNNWFTTSVETGSKIPVRTPKDVISYDSRGDKVSQHGSTCATMPNIPLIDLEAIGVSRRSVHQCHDHSESPPIPLPSPLPAAATVRDPDIALRKPATAPASVQSKVRKPAHAAWSSRSFMKRQLAPKPDFQHRQLTEEQSGGLRDAATGQPLGSKNNTARHMFHLRHATAKPF
eukprot:UC4_evm3s1489